MLGTVEVAAVASVCSLLQGWDSAAIAVAVIYIKRDYELEKNPNIEGLIVAMSFIGAIIVTTTSGAISDWVGRRPLLILSSILYFIGGLLILLAPNIYVLLAARLIDGFGVGLAIMLVPVYISEISPSDVRGFLNTLPQFSGCGGMFLSYSVFFAMSLIAKPDWRLMLGALAIPSFLALTLMTFYLPESPRWLVSKGRMMEAKMILQRLRGKEDVSGEMALFVEGLGAKGETSIEEYIIGPANELTDDQGGPTDEKERIILFGFEDGHCWVARPIAGPSVIGSTLVHAYHHGSIDNQICPIKDFVVTLFGCVHSNMPEMGSLRSTLFPNFGSMFTMSEQNLRTEQFYEEIGQMEGEGYASETVHSNSEEVLQSPLLSRQPSSMEVEDIVPLCVNDTVINIPRNLQGCEVIIGSTGIGGGWQLAWNWSEREGVDGKTAVEFKRIYLRQEGFPWSGTGSGVAISGADLPELPEYIKASALVSLPALCPKELMDQDPSGSGPIMFHPLENATKGPRWSDIFEAGVRHALFLGIGIQLLQQLAGINGILYYAPQILNQAGAEVLLKNMGIGSDSAAFLLGALATMLMLPCIAIAMRLVDIIGRRSMLLATIPILIVSSLVLIAANLIPMGMMIHAVLSTVSIIIYICCFVIGFGPIPSILCSEIFPTCSRGVCIAVCLLAFFLGAITATYSVPLLLSCVGLAGLFGICAAACIIGLVFVYLKVPETKGIPLEIITELFAVGAKKVARN